MQSNHLATHDWTSSPCTQPRHKRPATAQGAPEQTLIAQQHIHGSAEEFNHEISFSSRQELGSADIASSLPRACHTGVMLRLPRTASSTDACSCHHFIVHQQLQDCSPKLDGPSVSAFKLNSRCAPLLDCPAANGPDSSATHRKTAFQTARPARS